MKTLVSFGLLCSLLLFSECRKDRNIYTLKGRLVTSCDDPTPLAGEELYISATGGNSTESFITDSEGRFTLTYEDTWELEYIAIKGSQRNGHGSLTYLSHIPMEKNLDVGTIYFRDNYFFLGRISVQRPTSQQDTVFYDYSNLTGFKKFVTGPFQDGQVVDTFTSRAARIYDKDYPISATSPPKALPGMMYKIGSTGKTVYTEDDDPEVCTRYNYFDFVVE